MNIPIICPHDKTELVQQAAHFNCSKYQQYYFVKDTYVRKIGASCKQ